MSQTQKEFAAMLRNRKIIYVFTKVNRFTKVEEHLSLKIISSEFPGPATIIITFSTQMIRCRLQSIATQYFIHQGLMERRKMKKKYKFQFSVHGLMAYYSANFLHVESLHQYTIKDDIKTSDLFFQVISYVSHNKFYWSSFRSGIYIYKYFYLFVISCCRSEMVQSMKNIRTLVWKIPF